MYLPRAQEGPNEYAPKLLRVARSVVKADWKTVVLVRRRTGYEEENTGMGGAGRVTKKKTWLLQHMTGVSGVGEAELIRERISVPGPLTIIVGRPGPTVVGKGRAGASCRMRSPAHTLVDSDSDA